jgi:hypothetical protein
MAALSPKDIQERKVPSFVSYTSPAVLILALAGIGRHVEKRLRNFSFSATRTAR